MSFFIIKIIQLLRAEPQFEKKTKAFVKLNFLFVFFLEKLREKSE